MSTSQEQKVAVITGASQGIGAGLVQAYRKLGYGVVATSRSITEADDPEIVVVRGDIADADTAERVTNAALERFGRIDTLVNNAGIFVAKPFTDYTDEEYALVTGINLAGFFHLTRRVLPHLVAGGEGHIVTITTSFVDQPNSNVPSVLASLTKGGLSSATKSLAIEYATRGVRVNAVAPGVIKTPMHPVETHETLAGLHPVGRMGETSDVVDAVLYLESAPFVTGEILHVDGGQNAGH
ncbi:SDR family oxidoreductase [Micromonospora sp. NPDC094482]|uniref:SDR family NAD(P)-dependent oxidoreductase n=1 Tax=unclassified Micromonospora TaxID=2617518 RepID=UPI00332CC1A2